MARLTSNCIIYIVVDHSLALALVDFIDVAKLFRIDWGQFKAFPEEMEASKK